MISNTIYTLPNITVQELTFLKDATDSLNQDQQKKFMLIYISKRRNPQHLLFLALLGFVGAAGIQRFVTNKIGTGVLYFFTCGLFFIGTIVDIINHNDLANNYNKQMALETVTLVQLT
jgi:TM2 domain-containing membrane protein YozV